MIARGLKRIIETGSGSCHGMQLAGFSALPLPEQKSLLQAYQDFKDPGRVYRELSQAERVRSLAGERISSFIVVETSSITS